MAKLIIKIIIGLAILAFLYWTLSPLFYNKKVNEEPVLRVNQLNQATQSAQTSPTGLRGSFEGVIPLHDASGTVSVIENSGEYYLQFGEDFKVVNGPDLFVYLGKDNKYDSNTQISSLKGNQGSQNYKIPSSINIKDYSEVWVWCRAFSVPFGRAVLN